MDKTKRIGVTEVKRINGIASRLDCLNAKMTRMSRGWSPLLRDRLISIHVAASDERRHMSDEDVIELLGFDPTDIDNLTPPWRNSDFE
ncbi:hypothetical protein B7486_10770 [cyanobacterium TDX16]|nr:hypothetical protein B7486_10770 [cyanobacterium TDX16]